MFADTFHYIDERLSWLEAEARCNSIDGTLAWVGDEVTKNAIQDFLYNEIYSELGACRRPCSILAPEPCHFLNSMSFGNSRRACFSKQKHSGRPSIT